MAFPNPYFPATYAPYTPPVSSPAAPSDSGMKWVQGESGAKSYIIAPNSTVMLMDSEQDRFYIKSADASGMPSPLRVFEYTEITSGPSAPTVDYVTREEFDEFKASMAKPSRKVKSDESV